MQFQPDSLPYNTAPHYWIAVTGECASALALEKYGFQQQEGVYLTCVPCPWYDAWQMLEEVIGSLEQAQLTGSKLQVAVIPVSETPTYEVIAQYLGPVEDTRSIASSLWLGDALLSDRVVCYLQPIQDRRGKVFGYESFARVLLDNENVIAGGPIFAASRALKLEYRLDRYLHQKAVEAFIANEAENRLFINFQSGFIHRPEVYLEGLNHVVKKYNLPERNIVLEFTDSQALHNEQHLKAIGHYCRQQGYSISLDDITAAASLETLLGILQPDFIKLDMYLTQEAASNKEFSQILQLVRRAHESGITVIAEGVETKEVYDILMQAEVDLFQGYYIGHPSPQLQPPLARSANN